MANGYEKNSMNEDLQQNPDNIFDKSKIDKLDYRFISDLIETAQQTGHSVRQYGYRVDLPIAETFQFYKPLNDFTLSKNGYVIVDATVKKDKLVIDHEEGMTFGLIKAIESACGTETVPRSNENDQFNPWEHYISSDEAKIRLEILRNIRDYPEEEFRMKTIKTLYHAYDNALEKGTDPLQAIRDARIVLLAENIEQTMFEQDEYKASNDTRLSFLRGLPEPEELRKDPLLLSDTREQATKRVKDILTQGTDTPLLMTYLEHVSRYMNNVSIVTDEEIDQKLSDTPLTRITAPSADWLMSEMADLIDPEFLNKNPQEINLLQIENQSTEQLNEIARNSNMDIMSVYSYLTKEYDDVGNDLSLICENRIISDIQFVGLDDRYAIPLNKDQTDQLLEVLNAKAIEMVSQYSPMVSVKNNEALPIPYLINNTTDEIISFEEFNSKLEKLCSEAAFYHISDIPSVKMDPYTIYTILNNEALSFSIDYNYENVANAIKGELADYKQLRMEYSRILSDFVNSNKFGFEKGISEDGKIYYYHYGNQGKEIYHNAEELMHSPEMSAHLAEAVQTLQSAAKVIVSESSYVNEVPEVYSDWKYFVSYFNKNDENIRQFADTYKHELELMNLASNPRIADINLVYDSFSAQKDAVLSKKGTNRKANTNITL